MKRTALQLTFAAAAMFAAAATGSAQNLKAEVPFPFTVAGARMQPGDYSVNFGRIGGARQVVQVSSDETRRSVMAIPDSLNTPSASGPAEYTLTFACVSGNCELIHLRSGDSTVYNFAASKKTEGVRIATVMMRSGKS
jgi:hypothetical protein